MTVTILLADDHVLVRQGLRALLESQEDLIVVGETSDGLETIKKVEQLHPQVVVLDLMMPGLNGLEVTRQIHTSTHVLILSMHDNEGYVLEALRNGAFGYLLKDSPASELVRAIRAVAEGQRYLGPPFSELAIQSYIQKAKSGPLDPYDTLTNRERLILQLVAEGQSSAEISAQLSISPRTVEIHRSNLMHKLNLHTQTDLIRFAIRKNILLLDE